MIGEFVFDVVGYGTARALIPTLSLGRVRVDKPFQDNGGFNWFGYRREGDGAVLLESCAASRLGVLFWFLMLAVVLAFVA